MDKKLNNKQKIIQDSIRVMYLNGYNATSVQQLVDAADIPKGSFYYYFKTKEEYAFEALEYYMNDMGMERFLLFEDDQVLPLDRIKNFYRSKIDNLRDEDYKLGCFLGNLSQELADVNMEFSNITEKFYKQIAKRIEKCIVIAQETYNFKPIIEPTVLSNTIVNSWQGALVRMKSSRDNTPLDEFYYVLEEVFLKNK
ncbi:MULTISPECIES: TetR family transcriptional regulator C-terminal domain-containing protein [Bacillota]|uniref:TetR/AcrR family transcriptional regulator n=1 Tax=Bacillota TaxID=1239 RepID=UPI003F9517CF